MVAGLLARQPMPMAPVSLPPQVGTHFFSTCFRRRAWNRRSTNLEAAHERTPEMKKLKISSETLLPLDHRFPRKEAAGGASSACPTHLAHVSGTDALHTP